MPWAAALLLLAVVLVAVRVPVKEGKTAVEIVRDAVKQYAQNAESKANESKFAPYIADAEQRNGVPAGLLHRQMYQESRFRSDIIDGRTGSSAGAFGIAQIVPRWHPDVDPLDPIASIYYAAAYMKRLYDRFGSWSLALAAYNWGQGNQNRDLADGIIGNEWPDETRRYVAEITADVEVA